MNGSAAVAHGNVYTSGVQDFTPPVGGHLWTLDAETGEFKWGYRGAGGWTAPVVTSDRVCIGSSTEPFIACLQPEPDEDGKPQILWRTRIGGIFEESVPAISGKQLYILNTDHYLYAFE